MDVILTHERADFDAIASLLAAHKIYSDATPVLPGRIRKNVKQFLTLFGGQLPFISHKDLSKDPIERAIVVDTQTFSSVRGMTNDTAITVIDHHHLEEETDPSWNISIERNGANVTALVEQIKRRNISLTKIEATLLALGVYEDTGSLVYGSTTARDVYAAAWLLEQGAMLDVVRDHLRAPLTDEQRELYERLLVTAQSYEVSGYSILLAHAKAPERGMEVALMAYRLHDLFDPSAVLVLVEFSSHIQFVGRSSEDGVNVNVLAEKFGGGGHPRAAAARIMGKSLGDVLRTITETFEEAIEPSLRVADVMSFGARTFPPDMRTDDAYWQMRKYGYEGYPVVKDGKVVGLITRREVDRAMGHGLDGVQVEQWMQAGNIFVRPDTTLNGLQSLMVESGWGQVPVLNDKDEMVGIVTRTDLIKHVGREAHPANHPYNVVEQLESAMPPSILALMKEAGQEADEAHMNLFLVGGFVRDLLLNTPTLDIDFLVEGDSAKLARSLAGRFGGTAEVHSRFGTAKWHTTLAVWQKVSEVLEVTIENGDQLPNHIDFATARTEYYDQPSALPEVERSNIKQDLHRRDFTINTMTIRLNPSHYGELYDPYQGMEDLDAGSIRVLHPLSFIDDPTRMFRGVRFEQRLDFLIEPRTLSLVRSALPMLERLSGDRIRHEIELMFEESVPEVHLRRLDDLGVLDAIHHAFDFDNWTERAFRDVRQALEKPEWPEIGSSVDLREVYFELMIYRLGKDPVQEIGARLNLGKRILADCERIHQLRDQLDGLNGARPSEVDEAMRGTSDSSLLVVWAAETDERLRERIAEYAATLRHIQPITDGAALRERGLKPSPKYGKVLRRLRQAWLDGEISSEEEELALLDELLGE